MCLTTANPCPDCGKRCHLMAGVNVPSGEKSSRYLVCWTDKLLMKIEPGMQWKSMGKQPSGVHWKKHSKHHWQTLIRGEILDYWPTKKKWQFKGRIEIGNVEDFIKRATL